MQVIEGPTKGQVLHVHLKTLGREAAKAAARIHRASTDGAEAVLQSEGPVTW